MPSSGTPTPIDTSEPSDRSQSPKNPTVEKFATTSDSNVGPNKGRKPAWNVPSGTASPESAFPIMGAATWPALAATAAAAPATTTHSRSSPKSTSTASSSSTDDLKSLSDKSAASASVIRTYVSSPETVVVPASQQPRANPTPNLTRRGSTGCENSHSPQQNHRSSRWGQHYNNRRGNNNNNSSNNQHYGNNSRGGSRGRDRGGPIGNPSPGTQHFYWGNQVMTTAPPPPPLHYGFGPHMVHPSFYSPMGYELPHGPYPMFGHVPISAPQMVAQMVPSDFFSAGELEKRSSILKQVEFYFSEDNLCHDDYLRINMNNLGWVPISLIANFNRMRQLTNDLQLILESLNDSTVVEVQDNMVRKRDKWEKYLLPPSLQLEHAAVQMQCLNIKT